MGCMRYLSEAHLRGFERYKVSSFEKGSTAPTQWVVKINVPIGKPPFTVRSIVIKF